MSFVKPLSIFAIFLFTISATATYVGGKAVMFRDLWATFQKQFRMEEAETLWKLAKEYSDRAKAMGIKNIDESEYVKQMRDIASDEELQKKLKPMM